MTGIFAKMGSNAKLGGFTEEMLSSLKLIISFGKEEVKLKEYTKLAEETYEKSKRTAILMGFMGASFFAIIIGFSCFSWSVGYAMIKYEVHNPRYDRVTSVGDIVGTYQALMFGMFTVISIQNLIPAVIRALTVGHTVCSVIERKPLITNDLMRSVTTIEVQHPIRFVDVCFRYPTAPEHVKDVFEGASFEILGGTSTAIVGPSGTIVQMINRFYDPTDGEIVYGKI
jgi:ATP-binding cassette, subfamily B (MDR/TAP), member 1